MAHSFNIYWSIFNLYANKAKTKQSPWNVFISNTKKVMLKYIFNCCLISNKCQLGFVRSLRCKCSMHFLWPLSIRVHLRSKFQTAYYLFNNGNKKTGAIYKHLCTTTLLFWTLFFKIFKNTQTFLFYRISGAAWSEAEGLCKPHYGNQNFSLFANEVYFIIKKSSLVMKIAPLRTQLQR